MWPGICGKACRIGTVSYTHLDVYKRQLDTSGAVKSKKDITKGFDYAYANKKIESLLDQIAEKTLKWASDKTTTAIQRAELRRKMMDLPEGAEKEKARKEYIALSDEKIRNFYLEGTMPPHTRPLTDKEMADLHEYVEATKSRMRMKKLQQTDKNPTVFIQYGTCLLYTSRCV